MNQTVEFDCPFCGRDAVMTVDGRQEMLRCQSCGQRTTKAIEESRDDLRELADSDNPASELAAIMLGPINE